ncbi:hypothetical protein IWQ56_006932, partial [Coemansia nantahalensis]
MPKWLQEIETEVRRAAEIERQQAAQREGPATPPAEPPRVDLAAIRAALRPAPQAVPGFLWQAVKRAWQPPGSLWDWKPGEVQSVTAYTDGSMRQGATGPSMGFGACIRVRLSNAWGDMTREGDFQGRFVDGPCTSTMAELMAIAAVLAVVPPELTVAIHTDSQAAIAAMERVRSRPDGVWSGDRVLAPLMEWVAHWHSGRMGNVQLHKVKAHSGVPLNERADQLAGTAHNEGVQEWSLQLGPPPRRPYQLTWDRQRLALKSNTAVRLAEIGWMAQRLLLQVRAAHPEFSVCESELDATMRALSWYHGGDGRY